MDEPCEIWTGRIRDDGYPQLGGRLAHRLAYEREHGPIPPGLELDHLCNQRACVRVSHLEPVTHAENVRRSAARGTHREARKTHCPAGHAYDGHGAQWGDKRYCKTCRNEKARERRRLRAAA